MMPYRPRPRIISDLIQEIDRQIRKLGDSSFVDRDLRHKVRHLASLQRTFSDLGVSIAHDAGIDDRAAKSRLLSYLVMYVGVAVDGEELQIVSGISEYGRRVRQLRTEEGYQIASGASPDASTGIVLRPDQYLLVTSTPDTDAARRWHAVNRIRKRKGSATSRILEFLKENVGKVITTEELAYVAKDRRQYARRTRELRTEAGYAIATRFTGRPDLSMGQYVLESLDRVAPEHDRKIKAEVQAEVYRRDNNTCQCCGWTRSAWIRSDPRILELHHVEQHAAGGANSADNLTVLCSKCHDDVHAGRICIHVTDGGFVYRPVGDGV